MAEQVVDKLIIDIDVTGNANKELGDINKNLKNMGKTGKENISSTSGSSLLSSFSLLAGKIAVAGFAIKKTVSYFSSFVNESTAYTENLNLFRITFGDMADEAERFSNTFANALGLDVSQVMRNMGFFNQIASGFGLVEDKAYKISQTLTQIAYDISSFFDISVEESIAKVQSGLAGELEPLRRIGYALDQATLQQLAYNLGIQKSVREMTQAEKAQLRTIAIYEQSKNVMGDLAETIESPANQLRILKQQFTLLARSIGNIIIPLLNKVLPYVNGAVQGLTTVFNEIAKAFGFEIGDGVRETAQAINSVGEAVDDTINSTKKLLLPFDDFISLTNDLEKETTVGFDLEIPTYDALVGLNKISSVVDNVASTIRNMFLEFDDNGAIKGFKQEWIDLFEITKNYAILIYDNLISILPDLIKIFSRITPVIKDLLSFVANDLENIMNIMKVIFNVIMLILNPTLIFFKYSNEIKNVLTAIVELFDRIFSSGKVIFNKVFGNSLPSGNSLPNSNRGFSPEITGSLSDISRSGNLSLTSSVSGNNNISSTQNIGSAIENAAYRGMTRALASTNSAQGAGKNIVVPLYINGKEFTRATVRDIAEGLSSNYNITFPSR